MHIVDLQDAGYTKNLVEFPEKLAVTVVAFIQNGAKYTVMRTVKLIL